jgi:phosphotriesterase-related protein
VLINSVLGEISTTQLGWTSSHEHIFVNDAKSVIVEKAYPDTFPTDYIVREGIASLKRFKANGGGTVVDCTTVDLGRNVGLMARCSKESGVNIICTTGCWIDVPVVFQRSDPDALAALYIRDCTVGIEGTGIKAGIIKCAHESGVTWERGVGFTKAGETTARACARAAKATGLPITTHTEVAERIGLAQCELFEQEGVDMNRVYALRPT